MANSNTNIVISAEDKTRQAFDAVSSRLGKLSSSFSGLTGLLGGLSATAAVGYFVTATKNFADYADEIGKAAQKVGTTTEKLSELKYAGDLADVTFEQLQTGLSKLAKNAEDFKDGSKSAIDAFGKLKIDPTTFKDSADIFTAVAEKLSKMEDGARKTAIAQELLGKSGRELIPLLNEGAAGFAKAAQEAKAFGLVVSSETVAAAEKFNDNMTRIEKSAGVFGRTVGNELIPALVELTDNFVINTQKMGIFLATFAAVGNAVKIGISGTDAIKDAERELDLTRIILQRKQQIRDIKSQPESENKSVILGNVNKRLLAELKELDEVSARVSARESFTKSLKKQKTKDTQDEAASFEMLAKGINLTSVKLAELNAKQEQVSKSFKAGTITAEQYNEITKAIQKQRDEINKTTPVKKQASDQEVEAAKRFVESLQKKDETLGMSQSSMLAYEASNLKFNATQQQIVNSIIQRTQATELAREADAAWNEQIKLNQQSDENALNALEELSAAEDEDSKNRSQAYADMTENILRANEDLNINLITDDKKRIRAQVDLEHARSMERIASMMGESEEIQKAIDAEIEHYKLKLKEIDQRSTKTKSIGAEIGLTFKSAFEDAVVGGGKFSDVLKGLEQDIIRLAMRRTILDPLLNAFDQLFGNFSSSGGGSSLLNSITGIFTKNADGAVYNSPSLSAYSGGVYNSPQTFAFAKGAGVFAEAGPEAILPLKRGSNGQLGVQSEGAGAMNVTVNLIESTGNGGQVNQKQDGNNLTLDIMVEKIESMMGRNISQGRGIAPTMERQYGLNRAAGAY